MSFVGLSVGLCYWQIWHSVASVANSASVSEIHIVEPMQNYHQCAMASLHMNPLKKDRDGLGKK